jgi:hypothetical protein
MPISTEDLDAAIRSATTSLQTVASAICNTKFPKPKETLLETHSLSDTYIQDKLKDVPAGYSREYAESDFIYVIKIHKGTQELVSLIDKAFGSARNMQEDPDFRGKKDYCRQNSNGSFTLYVGRSQKLRSRLKQHFSGGDEGTFAMHMLRWAAPIQATIEVSYYHFKSLENLHVQALEDGLWMHFKPLFGRKGDK